MTLQRRKFYATTIPKEVRATDARTSPGFVLCRHHWRFPVRRWSSMDCGSIALVNSAILRMWDHRNNPDRCNVLAFPERIRQGAEGSHDPSVLYVNSASKGKRRSGPLGDTEELSVPNSLSQISWRCLIRRLINVGIRLKKCQVPQPDEPIVPSLSSSWSHCFIVVQKSRRERCQSHARVPSRSAGQRPRRSARPRRRPRRAARRRVRNYLSPVLDFVHFQLKTSSIEKPLKHGRRKQSDSRVAGGCRTALQFPDLQSHCSENIMKGGSGFAIPCGLLDDDLLRRSQVRPNERH